MSVVDSSLVLHTDTACTAPQDPAFELDLTGAAPPQETEPLTSDIVYFDVVGCTPAKEVTGIIKMKGSNASAALSVCVSLLLASMCALLW